MSIFNNLFNLFLFIVPLNTESTVPVPRDIPLPLPLSEGMLVVLLIFSFLLHILFINLMLGGSILTIWAEIKGQKNKEYNQLAKEIGNTITVNKSLAVVLGVAPLLSINALYTIFFYSANSLTGMMWISIVPLVSFVFLLLYYHKFTWKKYENNKRFHIGLMVVAVLLMLFIPLIFLTNINLMLFPGEWNKVSGFFSALMLRNVFFRYFHFLAASLAVTGLFLFGYMKRKNYDLDQVLPGFTRGQILKTWYRIALAASLLQLVLGPLNLFTLPWDAVTSHLIIVILCGAAFALLAMFLMWKELKGPEEKLGKRFYLIALILSITVLFMGTGRHIYRASALAPHMKNITQNSEAKNPSPLLQEHLSTPHL